MHAFIITSKDKKERENYALKMCQDLEIYNFDISIIEYQTGSASPGQGGNLEKIGIEEIRNLQKKIFLKPIKSKTKASIINNAQNLTVAAQNAMLKVLEEPPLNTIIILTASKKDFLLPTIQSRCKIIELKNNIDEFSKDEVSKLLEELELITSERVGDKLKLAQDLAKTKENTLTWLERIIISIRKIMVEGSDKNLTEQNLRNIIENIQKTYNIISTTNANHRLALENLFLNLL